MAAEPRKQLPVDEPKKVQQFVIPDMPESVLDGRLGEIYQRRLSMFPRAYAWIALVTVAGVMLPNISDNEEPEDKSEPESVVEFKPAPLRANLFASLVGGVQTGKSTACERAWLTLGIQQSRLLELKSGSAEGMLRKLAKGKGRRLVFPDELGHLMAKANIPDASFPYVLNSAFYKDRFSVIVAKGEELKFNGQLSILGGIVSEKFQESFGNQTTGGLHDRFLFGECPTGYSYDWRPFEGGPEKVEPISVEILSEVWEVKSYWLKTIPNLTPRVAELALRVAYICAAFDGRQTLSAFDLAPAMALAEYQARIRYGLRPNPGEPLDAKCAFAIKSFLQQHGPNGELIPRSSVAKGIHSERFGPRIFTQTIEAMVRDEQIVAPKPKASDAHRPVSFLGLAV